MTPGEDATPTIWDEFMKAFNNHFLPLKLREAKADEFINLKDTMSVKKYSLKFT